MGDKGECRKLNKGKFEKSYLPTLTRKKLALSKMKMIMQPCKQHGKTMGPFQKSIGLQNKNHLFFTNRLT